MKEFSSLSSDKSQTFITKTAPREMNKHNDGSFLRFKVKYWRAAAGGTYCHFLPRDASAERGDATVNRPSDRLSVRP